MRWVWDAAKAAVNKQKHGVSFELAERALGDPLALTVPDTSLEEERWRTLGSPSVSGRVVLFVHTWPDDETAPGRIISAREATRHERRDYEER